MTATKPVKVEADFPHDFDHCKSYKTIDSLKTALNKFNDLPGRWDYVMIAIPTGKNAGRFTVLFKHKDGEGTHWAHRGFMII